MRGIIFQPSSHHIDHSSMLYILPLNALYVPFMFCIVHKLIHLDHDLTQAPLCFISLSPEPFNTIIRNLHLSFTKVIIHVILFFLEFFSHLFHSFIFMHQFSHITYWSPSVLTNNSMSLVSTLSSSFLNHLPQIPCYFDTSLQKLDLIIILCCFLSCWQFVITEIFNYMLFNAFSNCLKMSSCKLNNPITFISRLGKW